MNLVYQIIERNPTDKTVTVRYTTDKIGALDLSPQQDFGGPKMRADGLVARCQGDLCIYIGSPDPANLQTLLVNHAPTDLLHAQELTQDPAAVAAVQTVTALAEQSITLP